MSEIILAYSDGDAELGELIAKKLGSNYLIHKVVCSREDSETQESWDTRFPGARHAIVLFTEELAETLKVASQREEGGRSILGSVEKNHSIEIIPIIKDTKQSLPQLDEFVCLCINDKSNLYIANYLYDYIGFRVSSAQREFKKKMFWISFGFLGLVTILYYLIRSNSMLHYQDDIAALYTMAYGALGAVVYILFNIIGVMSEHNFNLMDTNENYLRIILGATTGWISYILIRDLNMVDQQYMFVTIIVVAFLSGFSSKLVIGVINQGIRIVERALGIEQMSGGNK